MLPALIWERLWAYLPKTSIKSLQDRVEIAPLLGNIDPDTMRLIGRCCSNKIPILIHFKAHTSFVGAHCNNCCHRRFKKYPDGANNH